MYKLPLGYRASDKAPELEQLIALSQAMLENAEAERWDDLMVLEVERRELLERFFSEPIQQDDTEVIANAIHSILSIDEKILELGVAKRFDILQILQDLDQGKKAIKAYTS